MKKLFLLFMILPFVVHAQNAIQTSTHVMLFSRYKIFLGIAKTWNGEVELGICLHGVR